MYGIASALVPATGTVTAYCCEAWKVTVGLAEITTDYYRVYDCHHAVTVCLEN